MVSKGKSCSLELRILLIRRRVYGMRDDITLYFAHHEKLCLIDGEIAFMGGLDLCFGRVCSHFVF